MILKKSISVFLSLLLVLSAVSLSHAIAEDGYATIEAAGTYLRERIKAHDAEIRLTYLGKTSDISETYFTDLIDLILDEAFRHTGVPDEGSYIHSHHEAVNTSLSAQIAGDVCIVYLTFGIEYRTTLEQEAETTAKLLEVRKELGLDGKNDYEKVLAIHDYIIDHVTYDYEHVDDENYLPQFTACAALLDGVAVCQGYATLMYRMLLAEGIDCRFVTGYANGGPHGWNIVKLGDYYYNVDATFDDGEGMDRYECFLKCEKSFSDHLPDPEFQTDEFRTAYPISPTDYSGDGTELPENPGIIAEPTTAEPTTAEPTTAEPTTAEPTTVEP
ncbi:MAG: transglutaminase domain-containing protein, partial [Clostridia bacterium]|nr:transglutaminase domain-containing protein [Clostridia bacterium]